MSERITLDDCREVCRNLNRRLRPAEPVGKSYPIVVLERRYDYLAADEYDSQGGMRRTLFAGTKREVYEALWHMIRGIDLYTSC